MLGLNLSDIAIATVKSVDYRCIIYAISKSEAIHFLKSPVLDDREYVQNEYKKSILKIESTAIILTISSKQKN